MSTEQSSEQHPEQPFPGYTLHRELGAGGFAKVYLATQVNLRRKVALKVMNPELSRETEFCERFLREGRDMAVLSNHPDIVTIFDIDRVDDTYFIAMQYLPGPTLKQLLQASEPYPHPLHIVRRIAGALAYSHSKGFVHRDVKPANILFNESGEAVLSDFGIAKAQTRDKELTQVGLVIGTASYMSPEQAMQSEVLDGRSDLYSLGVMLFELLTRELPYKNSFKEPVLMQHINSPIPTLPASESIYQPLIDKLMAKHPDDRFATGYDLIEAIDKDYMKGNGDGPVTPEKPKWPLIATAILSVLLLVVAVDYGQRLTPDSSGTVITESDQEKIKRLIETAKVHELVGRIDQPEGSNAVEAWCMVLEIDPENSEAKKALERLRQQVGLKFCPEP